MPFGWCVVVLTRDFPIRVAPLSIHVEPVGCRYHVFQFIMKCIGNERVRATAHAVVGVDGVRVLGWWIKHQLIDWLGNTSLKFDAM